MDKKEIREYLKRVDDLELKLEKDDKEVLQWLIFGYNECARLLYEEENKTEKLEGKSQILEENNKLLIQQKYQMYEDLDNMSNELEKLKKENNDLRRIYQNTYKKYLENGNEEMAHYFMAQIDACPTFYVAPIIDYYKEYHKLENIIKEAIEYINKVGFPDWEDKLQDICVSGKSILNILNK